MLEDEKKKFAQCLIDGMDTTRASMTVFPIIDTLTEQEKNQIRSKRMIAAVQWETDSEVMAYTKEIMGVVEPLLDKKEVHIKKLNEIFDDNTIGVKDRLTASMQIAQIEGFISEKKEINNINNKILVVTRSATTEDWAKGIEKQQKDLVERTIEIKQDVASD